MKLSLSETIIGGRYKNIGGIIKKYRTIKHFTQEELAEKLELRPRLFPGGRIICPILMLL